MHTVFPVHFLIGRVFTIDEIGCPLISSSRVSVKAVSNNHVPNNVTTQSIVENSGGEKYHKTWDFVQISEV